MLYKKTYCKSRFDTTGNGDIRDCKSLISLYFFVVLALSLLILLSFSIVFNSMEKKNDPWI